MAGSVNKAILIGNLGRDPELKTTPGGQAVARFSLATTETWKDQAGEKQSKTEWHNVVVWGKQAEIAEKYLRKGKQVYVEGRIQYREYVGKDGAKKTATEIRCDSFIMLGRNEEGSGPARDSTYDDAPMSAPAYLTPGGGQPFLDDVPF